MLRSGYLLWLFSAEAAAGVAADVSPWVHAFAWARRREQWSTDPAGPNLHELAVLVDSSAGHLETALDATYGPLTPAQRAEVAAAMSDVLDDELASESFAQQFC